MGANKDQQLASTNLMLAVTGEDANPNGGRTNSPILSLNRFSIPALVSTFFRLRCFLDLYLETNDVYYREADKSQLANQILRYDENGY